MSPPSFCITKEYFMEVYNGEYCVYVHTNKMNGKKYVGQTCQNPKRRWDNGNGYKRCLLFYRAIQKYTWNGFDHEIVATNLTKEEANNFEKILIAKLDTMNPSIGYNLTSGGDSPIFSDDTRQRMSESAKNRVTNEWIEYISKINTGKKMSEETKKKISDCHKGKHVGENNNMYGRHHTEETKKKIGEASKRENLSEERFNKYHNKIGNKNPFYGRKHTEETKKKISEYRKKKIAQYDKEGNLIKIFDSIKQAAEEIGVTPHAIGSCLGKHNRMCKKFIWKYYDLKGDDI